MQIEREASFRHAMTKGGLNLFTGAGFSVLAKDEHGAALPTGAMLRDELAARFDVVGGSELGLAQLATIIASRDNARFEAFIRRRFTVADFDSRYRALHSIDVKAVLTVNVDDLVHRLYAGSPLHYVNDLDRRGSSHGDRTAIDYVALHGSVRDETRPFTFGSQDLAAVFARDPDRWHLLGSRLQQHASFFWGYSLDDAGVLQTLHPQTRGMRDAKPMWINVMPSSADEGTLAFFRAMGFHLIFSDTNELLDYMGTIEAPAVLHLKEGATSADVFPEYAIPIVDSLPVRPLDIFFDGAPPSWTDASSHRVPRLSHYDSIVESIHLHDNIAVIGIPGCGKSTMLMQAALGSDTDGFKLFTSGMSPEKAEMLIARLGGRPCTVFMDNFTDSIQACSRLAGERSIQVIGADRDYNFDIVSHMVDATQFSVLQVSDLTPEDIQAVYGAIPAHQRLPRYVKPRTGHGLEPSLFEVVQGNLTGPGLADRYSHAITQLERTDSCLVNLLLVTCYMQQARTFASTDVLLAFFRDIVSPNDYRELYEMVATLGRMLCRAEDWTPDDLQDYFAPRSPLLAEIILEKAAPPQALRRMLTRFWAEVSPCRIPNLPSFQRRACDWRLFRRAFPDADAGKTFYEYLLSKGRSAYVRQHGALYLADHKRYREAFRWIDEALSEPTLQGRAGAWTIRNSHAIILFKANIDASETPEATVETTLRRSMTILEECHDKDRRKAYHATTYAQQALSYHNRYHDERSKEYLSTARRWLFEERRSSPWNRAVQFLLRDLKAVR